ncbi:Phosphoribosylformylglycinamidine cyclo-ligase [Candidatus Entotheonellaceae bacterium PAL068K]
MSRGAMEQSSASYGVPMETSPPRTPYANAGVDLDLGDAASHVLYTAAKQTWDQRHDRFGKIIIPHDDFSGVRYIAIGALPADMVMGIGFDGIGTKIEIAERMGHWNTLAFDLFAMVCDDAIVQGAEPVLLGTVLDVRTLGDAPDSHLDKITQLAEGYVAAAAAARVAVVNGEIAECGSRIGGYGPFNLSWNAGVVWFARRARLLSGAAMRPGDAIVGLAETGCRSNGYSLLRHILQRQHGDAWHTVPLGHTHLGTLTLQPSRIYTAAVVDMLGGVHGEPQVDIHGVVHVTGGGLPGKLGRPLRRAGLGASITDPFSPSPLLHYLQELGPVSDLEAYRVWNMGQGLLIITPQPEATIAVAQQYGIAAQIVGEITTHAGIRLHSRGYFCADNAVLDYTV